MGLRMNSWLRYVLLSSFFFNLFIIKLHAFDSNHCKNEQIDDSSLNAIANIEFGEQFPLQDSELKNAFIITSFRKSLEYNRHKTQNHIFQKDEILLSEKLFDKFCLSTTSESSNDSPIPKIIHLIWLGSPVTLEVMQAVESWKTHHPTWRIEIWQDADLVDFPWSCKKSKDFFDEAQNWAERSDILRFELLYQFGGIYSDTDVLCLKSFECLLKRNISFFAGFETNSDYFGMLTLGSAVIGAAKNSPIIKRAIELSQTSQEASETPQHIRSGPGPLTKACYEALHAGKEDLLLLPSSYLYPLPPDSPGKHVDSIEQKTKIATESLAIHLWAGSWIDASTKSLVAKFIKTLVQKKKQETQAVQQWSPDFLVIGSPKCGTTTLFRNLVRHPNISGSVCETHFFSFYLDQEGAKKTFDEHWSWYQKTFPSPKKETSCVGEKSASYLTSVRAPSRIFYRCPNIKLIAILRPPVDRAYSHYWMMRRDEKILDTPFEEIADSFLKNNRKSPFLYLFKGSIYVNYLKKWLNIFPKEQILVINFNDLKKDLPSVFRRVLSFLGLPDYDESFSFQILNQYADKYPPIPFEIKQRLDEYYEPFNRELEQLLDMRFDWDG